jgi:hypothetical protein
MDNFDGATSLSQFSNPKEAVKFLRNYNAQQLNSLSFEPFVDLARKISHTKALLELHDFSTSQFSQGDNLIFIVGLPRSGKSSLEKILSNDPRCINGGELGTISDLFSSCDVNNSQLNYPLYMRDFDEKKFIEMGKQAIHSFLKEHPDPNKKLIITMPSNFLYIPLLQKILPNAKIIWCNRNNKHHAINLFIKHFKSNYWNFTCDMEEIVKVLQAHDKFHSFCEKRMDGHFLSVQYEDFLRNTKKNLRVVSQYLDLEWNTSEIQSHIQRERNYLTIIESEDALLRNYTPYFHELQSI